MFKKVYCHDEITHFCQGNYYNNRLFQIFSFSTQVFFLMSRLICLVSEADGNAFASLFFFGGGVDKVKSIQKEVNLNSITSY